MAYHEIECKTALNKLSKGKLPYKWDLNIYRGCLHKCQYCFALYSHKYMETGDFYKDIYVKKNIVERLEEQLSSKTWKREVVNIGGVTDSYQKVEETYQLMPDILKLFIKYKTPIIISSKSDLILRDYDLIDELSQITYVNIAATITTVDEVVRQLIEPGGVSSQRRFEMLRAFRKTNASIGVHMMPIIPYLTDTYENIDGLFAMTKAIDAHYILPGVMYLRGETRKSFFNFIAKSYPGYYTLFKDLYKKGGLDKAYKTQLYVMINTLLKHYGLSTKYKRVIDEKIHKDEGSDEQLSLF